MFQSLEEACGWLSGAIDSEGSVVVKGKTRGREVRITNTDQGFLAAVREALDMIGVAHVTYDRSERARLGKKPIFDVVISRRENLAKLAAAITMRTVKQEKLAELLAGYTKYGQRPEKEDFAVVYAEKGQRGSAEHYGVSKGTIYNWALRYGLVGELGRPKGRVWSSEEREARLSSVE